MTTVPYSYIQSLFSFGELVRFVQEGPGCNELRIQSRDPADSVYPTIRHACTAFDS